MQHKRSRQAGISPPDRKYLAAHPAQLALLTQLARQAAALLKTQQAITIANARPKEKQT
jgi:hypothetical protein